MQDGQWNRTTSQRSTHSMHTHICTYTHIYGTYTACTEHIHKACIETQYMYKHTQFMYKENTQVQTEDTNQNMYKTCDTHAQNTHVTQTYRPYNVGKHTTHRELLNTHNASINIGHITSLLCSQGND